MTDINYSVDMVKIKDYYKPNRYHLGILDNEDVINIIAQELLGVSEFYQLRETNRIKSWEDRRINLYRYNYAINTIDGNTIYIGALHNSEIAKRGITSIQVRYNPNKIILGLGVYPELDNLFKKKIISDRFQIKEMDIAIDINNYMDNIVVTKPKSTRDFKLYEKNGSKTVYIGSRGKGQIKVYDKAKELGINYPLTRVEFTLPLVDNKIKKSDIKELDIYQLSNVQVDFNNINKEITKNKTLNAMTYAVLNGYPIDNLTRTYKDKVKDIIDDYKIKIDNDKIVKTGYNYYKKINTYISKNVIIKNRK